MRLAALALILGLSACAAMESGAPATSETLTPSDAATSLLVGGPLIMTTQPPIAAQYGNDPLVVMSLRAPDGRTMGFEELNHAPEHVMAQSPGGPLAQAMSLTAGGETPKLYGARAGDNHGTPFLCGANGPVSIGYYEASDGAVTIIGMKANITFETMSDGQSHPIPFSPDQVCARLHLQRR